MRSAPAACAPRASASAPRIGLISPESDSSPQITSVMSASGSSPSAATTATAIARSKLGPDLRSDAGARLTVTRFCGKLTPEFARAARTRSRDSRTARSGSPTTEKAGSPRRMSTSTVTGTPSTPSRAKVRTFASMRGEAAPDCASPHMDPRRRLGELGEDEAVRHLERRGHAVLDRNFRTRYGELDVVSAVDGCLVFCEVKARTAGGLSRPRDGAGGGRSREAPPATPDGPRVAAPPRRRP